MKRIALNKTKNKNNNEKKFKVNSLKKIFLSNKKLLPFVFVSSIFAITSAVLSIIAPNKISDLLNMVTDGIREINGIDYNAFTSLAYVLIAFYVTMIICSTVQQIIMADVTQRLSFSLRRDINLKLNRLPLSYFDNNTVGDILSRITNDVDTISQTFGSSIASLFEAFIMLFGVIIMMFVSQWILAFITIGASIITFGGIGFVMMKAEEYFKKRQENLGQMNGRIEEDYTNLKVIKAYLAQDYSKKKFDNINGELAKNNRKAQFLTGTMLPIMNFTGNFAYALVFMFGVVLAINKPDLVSFGMIVSFTIYARLFSQPLQTFAQSFSSLQQASAASDRVYAILEEKEMENEDNKTFKFESIKGDVDFEHVNFSYNSEREIIKDFSASLKAGMKVAIVGPTGAGKTTMVNLLMRFYEVNKGDIKLDGHSLKEAKRDDVHALFDMILQDTWLFSGTVRDNLVFNKENVSDKKLDEACEAVGLTHYIKSLNNSYDTIIDPNNLSEGQKQQITIARALIKDSPLLILDEATSSVDTRTELKIQEAMDNMTKGRTSFVIAHRLSTIKNADIILVMKDGDIIEQGNHKQLLSQNGFYASLYNSQFETV